MVTLRDICERVDPVAPETTVGEAYARFAAEPTVRLTAVMSRAVCQGVLTRDALVRAAARPDAQVITIADLCLAPAHAVEAGELVAAFSASLLSEGEAGPLQGFVVLEAGRYLGVGDGLTLLRTTQAIPEATQSLLDGVRREVGGPLQGLLAVASLMQRQPLSHDGAGHLRTMIAAAQTSLAYLSDLTTHFDSATLSRELAAQPVCLQQLLDEVDVLWQVQAALRGVRLITSCRLDTGLKVCVDPIRFKQVLNAMVGEAFEASLGGVVEARLTTEVKGDRVSTRVQVRHSCSASDPEACDPEDETGVSPARIAMVVRALGGRIQRERNQGAGKSSILTLSLPVARPSADMDGSARNDGVLGHVLVVDDNATNRLVAEALCESFGFTCETAEDGAEAVDAVRLRAFDLVLMDIKMPGMDGLEATRAIRALSGSGSATPIVALTANADPEAVLGYFATGMCGVVEKPIKPEALFAAITSAIEGTADVAGEPAVAA